MNLAGFSSGVPGGYYQGLEQQARIAAQQEALAEIQREKLAKAGVARAAIAGGLSSGGMDPNGLGGLSSAPQFAPPPPPVGPGQSSPPSQPPQMQAQAPQGAPGPAPGSNGPPPPPFGAPPAQMPQGASTGGPPPSAAAPPSAGLTPPASAKPSGPAAPPPPAQQAGQQPAPQAPPSSAGQQGLQTPLMQQTQSQVGQLAQALVRANPQINTKTPEGALQIYRMIELSQQIQAPAAKEYVNQMKLVLQEQKMNNDFDAKIQDINRKAAADVQHADTALRVAEIGRARAEAVAEINRARSESAEAHRDTRAETAEAGRNSRNEASIEGRKDLAQTRSRADMVKTATKAGVEVDPSWEPAEIQKHTAAALAKKAETTTLSPDDVKWVAEASQTDPSILSRLGTGPTGNANKTAVLHALAGSAQPESLGQAKVGLAGSQAESNTIGRQSGNVALGTKELDQFAPLVLQSAKDLPRTQYPTVNSVIQAAQRGSGDPRIVALANNIQALKSAYTQILIRGGQGGADARRRTDELIAPNMAPAQLDAAIKTMYQESRGAGAAAKAAASENRANVGRREPAEAAAPSDTGAPPGAAENDPLGIR